MLRAARRALAIGIASFFVTGCGGVGPMQSADFASDKRGATVSIPLEVLPGGAFNVKDTYVLALGFDASSGDVAIQQFFGTAPTMSTMRLRVNLVRTEGGWDEHVPFSTCASARAIQACDRKYVYDGSKDQSVVSTLRQRGIGRSEANMEIASFRFPSFGKYRIDLEAIDDQPALRGVHTSVYVTVPFGYPK
ncbi:MULTISPECIES: hypothetical protein [unclassified Luteibacter]|uniref:hypothetical protein n=1 Tax=Luteibacter sp. PvP019 TaxID=3156436 RepID=UPI0033907B71